MPFLNKEFNIGQPRGALSSVKLASPEVMVKVVCNIHPFMSAWVGVLEHPFFAVTDALGNFAINELPAGKYTIAVWHEKLEAPDQEIVVTRARRVEFGCILR
jgi:hypothetical protein